MHNRTLQLARYLSTNAGRTNTLPTSPVLKRRWLLFNFKSARAAGQTIGAIIATANAGRSLTFYTMPVRGATGQKRVPARERGISMAADKPVYTETTIFDPATQSYVRRKVSTLHDATPFTFPCRHCSD